jgi:hypothetical protein
VLVHGRWSFCNPPVVGKLVGVVALQWRRCRLCNMCITWVLALQYVYNMGVGFAICV